METSSFVDGVFVHNRHFCGFTQSTGAPHFCISLSRTVRHTEVRRIEFETCFLIQSSDPLPMKDYDIDMHVRIQLKRDSFFFLKIFQGDAGDPLRCKYANTKLTFSGQICRRSISIFLLSFRIQ